MLTPDYVVLHGRALIQLDLVAARSVVNRISHGQLTYLEAADLVRAHRDCLIHGIGALTTLLAGAAVAGCPGAGEAVTLLEQAKLIALNEITCIDQTVRLFSVRWWRQPAAMTPVQAAEAIRGFG